MVFSSLVFIFVFLPSVIGVYYICEKKYRNMILLVSSLFFYAWGEPIYILLMLFSIIVNYYIGLLMNRSNNKSLYLKIGVIFNVFLLFYFKYMFTILAEIYNILKLDASNIKIQALPIGISFYTFQIMSYIIDLYRGEIKVQRNICDFALYVSFFPQLIAGPIVKYIDIEEALSNRIIKSEDVYYGVKRFIYGFGKKIIISNTIAGIVTSLFGNDVISLGSMYAWLGVCLYTLQIYYDFSGYSDMAIGLGRIFGFKFMENFNYPYISQSITEFWRRWHISLSTWFKQYIYIPLGGNRKGKTRKYINKWIIFLITGIWHGATFNFWLWGIWHGIFIFLESIFLEPLLKKNKLKILNHLYVYFVVIVGWAMFRCDSLKEAIDLLIVMFNFSGMTCGLEWYNLFSIRDFLIIAAAVTLMGPLQKRIPFIKSKLYDSSSVSVIEFILLIIILLFSMILLISGQYNPFIYYKF